MKRHTLIFASVVIAISLSGCKETDYCTDTTMAYVIGQNFVKTRLKDPGRAVFPTMNINRGVGASQSGYCRFITTGYVDAKNSFGGNVRIDYVTEVEYSKMTKKWKLININIKK